MLPHPEVCTHFVAKIGVKTEALCNKTKGLAFFLLTLDHKVPGSSPAGRGIQLMKLHCIEPFIITIPSSQYDLMLKWT